MMARISVVAVEVPEVRILIIVWRCCLWRLLMDWVCSKWQRGVKDNYIDWENDDAIAREAEAHEKNKFGRKKKKQDLFWTWQVWVAC